MRVFAVAAALVSLALPAAAGEGASTAFLNVRAGPTSSTARVGGLSPGDVVQIIRCEPNLWCQVAGAGVEGWVASRYLTAGPGYPQMDPRCQWELDVALPDPQFRAACPAGVDPPPPPPPPGDLACLFERDTYGGTRTCLEPGDYMRLDPEFDNTISSVQVQGDAKVRLCTEPDLGGICMDWLTNATEIDRRMDDTASSVKVYVGFLPPPPPPPPEVHSEGTLTMTVNGRANLDAGDPGPAGADIWWRPRQTGALIAPVNGAQLSLGDGSDRSLHACRRESYFEVPIDVATLSGGEVVCIKTNMGRVGRFAISEIGDRTLAIDYVTWAE